MYLQGGQQLSGAASTNYSQSLYDQQRSRPRAKYNTKGYSTNVDESGEGGGIPALDSSDRTSNAGRSLFASYLNTDKQPAPNMRLSSEEKAQSSMEYGALRVPQIGRLVAGATAQGVINLNATGILQQTSVTGASPRMPSGRDSSSGLGQRRVNNRNEYRQSGSRSRRLKQLDATGGSDYLTGKGQGGDGTSGGGTGSVLPHISGGGPPLGTTGTPVQGASALGPMSSPTGGVAGSGAIGSTPAGAISTSAQLRRTQQLLQASQMGAAGGRESGVASNTEEYQSAAVTTIKGLKPGNPNWINQDNYIVIERFEGKDYNIYCVLDGHGENGHHVSKRCRENLPVHIRASGTDMKRAFSLMQNELLSCEFDSRCSGATCVLAVISGGKLSVSNCGDSRAVLARRNSSGQVVAHALTSDHKPDKPEERKRILGCGGHLGCRHVIVNQAGKGPTSVPVGPCRVWYQHRGETLGLAMSRSLGDSIVHKSGVSAEPETLEHMLDDSDEFIVIATDGIWDVMDNQQVIQMVVQYAASRPTGWSLADASAMLTRFARARWEKLSPMVDDITCIVVRLKR